jgi:putative transposase
LRFAFIQNHRQEFPVKIMCDVLEVSRSGYYAWLNRVPSAQALHREELTEQIIAIHKQSRACYGSPRIYQELKGRGVACSENTIAKLMKKRGIRSKRQRRFVVRTTNSNHAHPVFENRLARQFQQTLPNQAWAADITYIPTSEGWLYLAAVIDLCSRKVIGWATADHLQAELVCKALEMALGQRDITEELLHHSDRGVQYACDAYQQLLAQHNIACSMSRTGNCYDNAVMESFFSTLKCELVHHEDYPTRSAARQSLFEYIEVFYNRQRRHSTLNYKNPTEFEDNLN